MAFSTTMLAWSVIEFGKLMGPDLKHALDSIRWATDYFLKATSTPGLVFAVVGDPYSDHNCWERPEDMDTPRTAYAVSKDYPGSEVSAEIAAALAASSIVYRKYHLGYSRRLLQRAIMVCNRSWDWTLVRLTFNRHSRLPTVLAACAILLHIC